MPSRRRAFLVLSLLSLLALGSLSLALATGSVAVSLADMFPGTGGGSSLASQVLIELRLPRALAAFACGGLLALAGALMQVLLRNPLADPYVLGVSGGAAVGALLAMLFGLPLMLVDGGAFGGALAATLLVFALGHGEGAWTATRTLLTGVIVAAGCSAVVALILAVAPEAQLRGMLFWLLGDLGHAGTPKAAVVTLALTLALALPFARDLNVLARGGMAARALGVPVARLRAGIQVVASLATAVAVTTAGSIGFVGLVVPHLTRLAMGNDQRLLLPAATLAGGTLLTLADTVARSIAAPTELPVGALTAVIGVPIFLFLLTRRGGLP
ncbi:MAG TPA: iron ABC transporter permease [Rhodocyclaceae bacterium]|nr:iron ABC transporter permease [Rhodocyclaceae bacterium]